MLPSRWRWQASDLRGTVQTSPWSTPGTTPTPQTSETSPVVSVGFLILPDEVKKKTPERSQRSADPCREANSPRSHDDRHREVQRGGPTHISSEQATLSDGVPVSHHGGRGHPEPPGGSQDAAHPALPDTAPRLREQPRASQGFEPAPVRRPARYPQLSRISTVTLGMASPLTSPRAASISRLAARAASTAASL
jgi:hypothetical protein